MKKVDIFKLSIVVLFAFLIAIFYLYSRNGRYYLSNDGRSIIDTRTGETYYISGKDTKAEKIINALDK